MEDESKYYKELKQLAREQRATFGLQTSSIGRREFREIYKKFGIKLHLWPKPGLSGCNLKHLRGAYLNVDGDLHVMVDRTLPNDPYLFTLAHEVKHHLCDQEHAKAFCHDENQTDVLEIGAEVFAAELLYPEQDFNRDLNERGIKKGECTQKDLVALKHDTGTSLSYTGLRKRAVNFGYASVSMPNTGWKRIEVEMYGLPYNPNRARVVRFA
jgi:hypothetical protein